MIFNKTTLLVLIIFVILLCINYSEFENYQDIKEKNRVNNSKQHLFNQVLDNTIFSGNINFSSILMTPIIFGALVLLSVQIPTLCSTLSGGIGISGLVGGLGTIANPSKKAAAFAGKGAYKGGKALTQFASNIRKGKIKPG